MPHHRGCEEGDEPAGHGGVGGEVGPDDPAVELRQVGQRGTGIEVGDEVVAVNAGLDCVGAEVEVTHGMGVWAEQRLVCGVSGWDLERRTQV